MFTLKNKKGFTLVELLVVISIISLLTSIVLASLNDARKKARDSARISSVLQVQKALAMYFSENGHYPTYNGAAALGQLVAGNYISAVDANTIAYQVFSSDSNMSPICFANGNANISNCQTYRLGIALEDRTNKILSSSINDYSSATVGKVDLKSDTCFYVNGVYDPSGTSLCFGIKP